MLIKILKYVKQVETTMTVFFFSLPRLRFVLLSKLTNAGELRSLSILRHVHIFNSQELHCYFSNFLRELAWQSVILPPFCVVPVIQAQNVETTFYRCNFRHIQNVTKGSIGRDGQKWSSRACFYSHPLFSSQI